MSEDELTQALEDVANILAEAGNRLGAMKRYDEGSRFHRAGHLAGLICATMRIRSDMTAGTTIHDAARVLTQAYLKTDADTPYPPKQETET